MADKINNKIVSVPQQIFEQFLKELGEQKIPEEVVERLRKTLVDNPQISVETLKLALFANDNTTI